MCLPFKMVHSIGGRVHGQFVILEVSLGGDGSIRSKKGTGTGL